MEKKEEIEFLMGLRKTAQEMVDKLTLRIVELQEKSDDGNKVGFKNGEKASEAPNDRD